MHARSYKSGDADDIIHLNGGRSHSLRNRSGQAASRAGRCKTAFLNGFTDVKIGDNASTYGVFTPKNSAFRHGARDFYRGEVGVAKNSTKLDVSGGRYDTGGGLLGAAQAAPNQAKDQVAASGGYDECNQ